MTSTSSNVLKYLQEHPGEHIAAFLERDVSFLNRYGNRASAKSVRNRLQDLARNGEIHVEEREGKAYYSATPKQKEIYYVRHPLTGERITIQQLAAL